MPEADVELRISQATVVWLATETRCSVGHVSKPSAQDTPSDRKGKRLS